MTSVRPWASRRPARSPTSTRKILSGRPLLQGRMIVYKDVERWGWHDGVFEEVAVEEEIDARE
jgi:hypothetical protein